MPFFEWIVRQRVNSSRIYLDRLVHEAAASIPSGGRVLDAGAGICMYKHYFNDKVYESADFCQLNKEYGEITYVCDLAHIPVEDARFDFVLSTQTLEHVPEPWNVLKELCRVLKPGGRLLLSAPFYFEEHELPYDYYRYTRYGMQYLVELAGFKIEQLDWVEGYYGAMSRQFAVSYRSLSINPQHYGGDFVGYLTAIMIFFLKPFFGFLSIIFSHMDIHHKFTSAGHCKNYIITAVKPA